MRVLGTVVPGSNAAKSRHGRSVALAGDEVHLWFASLERTGSEVLHFTGVLSEDEGARAARFLFERDRRRFVVARGWLRTILGGYLQTPPGAIRFAYGEFGKPVLPDAGDLCFNLSHSDERVLCAVTRERQVGVDLERLRPMPEMDAIAAQVFSAREQAAYRSVAPDARARAFFNGWTRKEAYIKAIGDGLSCPLERFDVSLTPGEPARLLGVEGDLAAPARWTLHAWDPEPGCVAAVAVEGCDCRVVGRHAQPGAVES